MSTAPVGTFRELLRSYRSALGLSQEALAERTRLSVRGISDLERGINRTPHHHTVQRLTEALALTEAERAAFEVSALRIPRPGATSTQEDTFSLLPVPLTPLLGRQRETSALAQLVRQDGVRLITLTGPGGVGKTRLALQVAAETAALFAHGATFVRLAAVQDHQWVLGVLAQSLGLPESTGQSPLRALIEYVRPRRMLLLLDNFEHLLPAASAVAALLEACPDLKVLVTSRAPLCLRGERQVGVAPLVLPDLTCLPSPEALTSIPAVALFVQRAQETRPAFALTPSNAAAIAEICVRLDGLPLAIELAAAQIKLFPPHALLARLEHRLRSLTSGARDLPERQQTLRATISWSYQLLTQPEQTLFRRLAVFAGGCPIAACQPVCGNVPDQTGHFPVDVEPLLAALVDKCVLRSEEQTDGEPRVGMLETIREYSLERLTASGEGDAIYRHYVLYFLDKAEALASLIDAAEREAGLTWLDRECPNLRVALQWLRDHGEGTLGLRLAGALGWFWYARSSPSEARGSLEELLAMPAGGQEIPLPIRARALNTLGTLARIQGDYATASAYLGESLTLFRAVDDRAGIAGLLNNLGLVARRQGDYQRAATLHEEGLAVFREINNTWGISLSLCNLGAVLREQGDPAQAAVLLEQSLELDRSLGDKGDIAACLAHLGNTVRDQGDYVRARSMHEESLVLYQECGDRQGIAPALCNLGDMAGAEGDHQRAAAFYEQSLAHFGKVGAQSGAAACLERLARIGQP